MNLTEVDDKELEAEADEYVLKIKRKGVFIKKKLHVEYARQLKEYDERLARRVRAIFPEATDKQIDALYLVYNDYLDWH